MTVFLWIAAALATIGLVLVAVSVAGTRALVRRYPSRGTFADAGGVRLHYLDQPARSGDAAELPPVVFIHGASGNLAEPLSALGDRLLDRRTIWIDRPGHGHSSRGSRAMAAPAAQAAVIAGLIDRLGIEKAVIVGHSLGGSVAAAMGVLHPEKVAGLVFVAPATHPWPGGVTWYYTASMLPAVGAGFAWTLAYPIGSLVMRRAAAGVFDPEPMPDGYPERAEVALVLRPASFLANAADVAHLKANVEALSPRYREIRAPTVIVTGDRDTVVWPSIHSAGLLRDVPGAELVTISGAGHMLHHTRPEAVLAAIDRVTQRASTMA